MKKGYRVFSHTADIGLHIRGRTMEALFKNAARGMTSLITEQEKFAPRKKATLSVHSDTWESLLVDWLGEILYYFTVKRMGFCTLKIKKINAFSIDAIGYGEEIRLDHHPVFREIKAVTYHDLKIKKTKGGYSTKIIFDI